MDDRCAFTVDETEEKIGGEKCAIKNDNLKKWFHLNHLGWPKLS